MITIDGEKRTLKGWLEHAPICRATYHSRVKSGWTSEEALTTPPLTVVGQVSKPMKRHPTIAEFRDASTEDEIELLLDDHPGPVSDRLYKLLTQKAISIPATYERIHRYLLQHDRDRQHNRG